MNSGECKPDLDSERLKSPRPAPEYIPVPARAYERIGQGYLDVREQLQALWDAVYLTHPDKEQLLRAYVRRLDQLRGGATPMLTDTAVELEELARSLQRDASASALSATVE